MPGDSPPRPPPQIQPGGGLLYMHCTTWGSHYTYNIQIVCVCVGGGIEWQSLCIQPGWGTEYIVTVNTHTTYSLEVGGEALYKHLRGEGRV